jgi:hypothetical protein
MELPDYLEFVIPMLKKAAIDKDKEEFIRLCQVVINTVNDVITVIKKGGKNENNNL